MDEREGLIESIVARQKRLKACRGPRSAARVDALAGIAGRLD